MGAQEYGARDGPDFGVDASGRVVASVDGGGPEDSACQHGGGGGECGQYQWRPRRECRHPNAAGSRAASARLGSARGPRRQRAEGGRSGSECGGCKPIAPYTRQPRWGCTARPRRLDRPDPDIRGHAARGSGRCALGCAGPRGDLGRPRPGDGAAHRHDPDHRHINGGARGGQSARHREGGACRACTAGGR